MWICVKTSFDKYSKFIIFIFGFCIFNMISLRKLMDVLFCHMIGEILFSGFL